MRKKGSYSAIFPIILFLASCQTNPYREGERLYKNTCANCHMDQGEGLRGLIPPLRNADYLHLHREKLPCVLKYGLTDTISVNGQTYTEQMPGVPTLTEIQITNILNYINNSWGNQNAPYSLEDTRRMLEKCAR
ncbi:MAG: cytochrome c [Saprospiraceae bacterium]|nr:cytochrome c [Lewinellaceae bacterium]